jgi:hypothetical protein
MKDSESRARKIEDSPIKKNKLDGTMPISEVTDLNVSGRSSLRVDHNLALG